MTEDRLSFLPCPMCGEPFKMGQEPHDNHPVGGKFYIFHDYGPLGSPARRCPIEVHRHFDTEALAIAAWNTRALSVQDRNDGEIEARLRKLSVILVDHFGGGSEWFSRIGDDFYVDPEAARVELQRRKTEARVTKRALVEAKRTAPSIQGPAHEA